MVAFAQTWLSRSVDRTNGSLEQLEGMTPHVRGAVGDLVVPEQLTVDQRRTGHLSEMRGALANVEVHVLDVAPDALYLLMSVTGEDVPPVVRDQRTHRGLAAIPVVPVRVMTLNRKLAVLAERSGGQWRWDRNEAPDRTVTVEYLRMQQSREAPAQWQQ